MEPLYVRACYVDPMADSKYSGHYSHLNGGCCDPDAPCEGVDIEDYIYIDGEYIYHPYDGVCAVEVHIDDDGDISIDQTYAVLGKVYLFEGEEIPSFYIDDGVFVKPTKIVAGPFPSAIEVEEYIRKELLQ